MTTADVEAKLGKPQEMIAEPDGTVVWQYVAQDRTISILFEGGRVTRILDAKTPEPTGPKLLKVSGTVKFKDGSPLVVPEGGRAVVSFTPADTGGLPPGAIRKGAAGAIKEGGRFEMLTIKPGDGVIPGRYRVFLVTQKNVAANPNDPANQLVPQKYTSAETSGLEVTIEKPTSDLVIELDK